MKINSLNSKYFGPVKDFMDREAKKILTLIEMSFNQGGELYSFFKDDLLEYPKETLSATSLVCRLDESLDAEVVREILFDIKRLVTLNVELVGYNFFRDLLMSKTFKMCSKESMKLGMTSNQEKNKLKRAAMVVNSGCHKDTKTVELQGDFFENSQNGCVAKSFPVNDLYDVDQTLITPSYDAVVQDLNDHRRMVVEKITMNISIQNEGNVELLVGITDYCSRELKNVSRILARRMITQYQSTGFAIIPSGEIKDFQYVTTPERILGDSSAAHSIWNSDNRSSPERKLFFLVCAITPFGVLSSHVSIIGRVHFVYNFRLFNKRWGCTYSIPDKVKGRSLKRIHELFPPPFDRAKRYDEISDLKRKIRVRFRSRSKSI